jgi:hypothetical protein
MKKLNFFAITLTLIVALVSAHAVALSTTRDDGKVKEVRFKVLIENISNPEGQTASDGSRWPFAVSPGVWAVSRKNVSLFSDGKPAGTSGLEAQAEDGNPMMLQDSLQMESGHMSKAAALMSGVFNIPVGKDAPGPILPGNSYEFSFTAAPGMKLNMAMMFGQSNDLFYAPYSGIALFNSMGQPESGDFTYKFVLWDAGTEVNQEPGIGPDQAPRQKMPNTGLAENGKVRSVKDKFTYPKTADVLRITITPEK